MDPSLVHKSSSILGAVVVMKQRSTRDSWLRKKYMGVWRCMSAPIASKSSRFPRRPSRKRARKILKRNCHFSRSLDNPERTKSGVWLQFILVLHERIGMKRIHSLQTPGLTATWILPLGSGSPLHHQLRNRN
jgi:hypothetical protein